MSDHKQFIENAKKRLDGVGAELDHLDQQLKTAANKADAWYADQVQKLRSDLDDAKSYVEKVSTDAKDRTDASLDQVKTDAERHWKALQNAVATYRRQVETTASK